MAIGASSWRACGAAVQKVGRVLVQAIRDWVTSSRAYWRRIGSRRVRGGREMRRAARFRVPLAHAWADWTETDGQNWGRTGAGTGTGSRDGDRWWQSWPGLQVRCTSDLLYRCSTGEVLLYILYCTVTVKLPVPFALVLAAVVVVVVVVAHWGACHPRAHTRCLFWPAILAALVHFRSGTCYHVIHPTTPHTNTVAHQRVSLPWSSHTHGPPSRHMLG